MVRKSRKSFVLACYRQCFIDLQYLSYRHGSYVPSPWQSRQQILIVPARLGVRLRGRHCSGNLQGAGG